MIAVNKLKIYVDFDECVCKSSDRIAEFARLKYGDSPDFNYVKGCDIKTWNASEIPQLTMEDMTEVFSSDWFFETCELHPNCQEILEKLSQDERYEISFCSIGSSENIALKTEYLNKHFPFITRHWMIVQNGTHDIVMDKSKIVNDGMCIDDHQKNLASAKYPVLFTDRGMTEWNKDIYYSDKVVYVNKWEQVEHIAEEFWKRENR